MRTQRRNPVPLPFLYSIISNMYDTYLSNSTITEEPCDPGMTKKSNKIKSRPIEAAFYFLFYSYPYTRLKIVSTCLK